MKMTPRTNVLRQWLVYALMTLSFGAAVILKGGDNPRQWEWTALGVSLAAILAILPGPRWERAPRESFGFGVLVLLLGWMVFQVTPLPPAILTHIAPTRWTAVEAARLATGQSLNSSLTSWAAISAAPPASFERLLDILPAMAALVAAREMGWWWRGRGWIPFAPIVAIAWLESLAGLLQFSLARTNAAGRTEGGSATAMATGTYVYHNHFSGLLEMAFPIAALWAVWAWRKGNWQRQERLAPALQAAALLGVAACLFLGIVASLSRMGFASTIGAAALTALAVLASRPIRRRSSAGRRPAFKPWLRSAPAAAALAAVLVMLPPKELMARFAELDLTQDSRAQMWADTTRLIHDSLWLGAGVGAFEQGLYRYKRSMPLNTVDFAHNDYLQILAELGIPGAVLAGALTVWVLAKLAAVVIWLGGSPNWEFAVGLLGALLTLALHSCADFNFYLPSNALALAWLAGLAVSPGLKGR
jgi:O-antigen ligase